MSNLKVLKELKFWVLAIAAALITLHLHLTWRSDNTELLSTSFLFWLAVSSLLWKKRDALNLESGVLSSFFGASLIILVLIKSLHLSNSVSFLRISPFISLLGLCLLASGLKGLKQYWQELLLLAFLAIAQGWILLIGDISIFTAKFAAFVLWLLGFEVSRQGVFIILPKGSIEVYSGCSGIGLILQLLGLAFIILVMIPTNLNKKILLPVVAIVLGFAVNGVRVALMAVLVALSHQQAFEYWHTGDGSLIFSTSAVLIFGLFCHFMVLKTVRLQS
ncbi:cyanoexosortase A [Trichocoleus sp. FACHB-90]|uniref:cyanoexosortase A n=1 Tax=Cyanophyceae TaxID=3028117 RepID=UPI00168387C0|nr:cyanoexosortase A [Trichocoleus sp. FACHB-90]MBD1927184.1 cyanoexosortase A [Trichocoleus sp. FACHB-90]